MATTQYLGGCHCGAVRFAVDLDLSAGATRCNCSICSKTAAMSALAKPEALSLRSGAADLGAYVWGARTARRCFCMRCGIHCFGRGYLAEVGGDYVSVNLHVLDDVDPSTLEVVYWDGRHDNWEAGPRDAPWPIRAAA